MTQSSFLSYVGIARDSTNASLAAAVAVGATSYYLYDTTGTPTSAMTMFIVDGVNSEQVAVTAYTAVSNLITAAACVYAHSANAYVYFQLTASTGPTAWLPVTSLDFQDDITQLYDKGYRGNNVEVYGAVQGQRISTISIGGDLSADTIGYFLASAVGLPDYVATVASTTPSTWTFAAYNKLTTQPTPFIFYDFNPAGNAPGLTAGNMRVYAMGSVSDLTLNFDPGALITYKATVKAMSSGVLTGTIPTKSFTAYKPVPARTAVVTTSIKRTPTAVAATTMTLASVAGLMPGMSVTGAGVSNCTIASIAGLIVTLQGTTTVATVSSYVFSTPENKALTAEISFKRGEFGPVTTLDGTADPMQIYSGPLAVTGKMTLVVDDDAQFQNYLYQTQPAFNLSALQGTAEFVNGIAIQVTQANYENLKLMQTGKGYITLEVPFTALANSTDGNTAGGGSSPAKVTLSVGTTTGSATTPY